MSYKLDQFLVGDYRAIFDDIADGNLSDQEIKEFLLELNKYGFSADAFLGAIQAFKPRCKKIAAPDDAIDVCGTGGDKLNTLNISTAVALIAAACGVKVAKHGNKAISSKSGSADVLSELGIDILADSKKIAASLKQNNLCFIFAPLYHPAFKNVVKIRQQLAVPTIFNFLGPLLNPADTKLQLIGTSKKETMLPMLQALQKSGSKKVFIVHGLDGMDEITITNNSLIAKLENGVISGPEILNPQDYNIAKSTIDKIKGGDAKYNAQAILDLFSGKKSAYRDIVLLNSALALMVAGKVQKIEDGIIMAQNAIDDGKATKLLNSINK